MFDLFCAYTQNEVDSGLTDGHRCAYRYQSTTSETMLKLLFLYFSEYGIFYKNSKDFSLRKGTYIVSKERINFGALPNQSANDLD